MEPKFKLYLQKTTTSKGGRSLSSKPYSCREPQYLQTTFEGITRSDGEGFFPRGEEIVVSQEIYEASRVAVVIVRYSDGDSFGTTYGYHKVFGVYLDDDVAMETAESISKGDYGAKQKDKCFAWMGYFANIEDVEVHSFRVRGNHGVTYHP